MLTMYDSVSLDQVPADAQAVACYVDGEFANEAEAIRRFPHARILTIAVFAHDDADCLDIEEGDATPAQAAAWYLRQKARGVTRPCLYASAFLMDTEVIPAVVAAGIKPAEIRLWSAHYTHKPHVCGPSSCRELGITADGTQWTNRALGRTLDQSLLDGDFFGTPVQPKPKPATTEDDMPSGLIMTPPGVRETHGWPAGAAGEIILHSDWQGVQAVPPVVDLRIIHKNSPVFDAGHRDVDRTATYTISNPGDCNGCSFTRIDGGAATVSFHTNP